jgi:hypothetical protein
MIKEGSAGVQFAVTLHLVSAALGVDFQVTNFAFSLSAFLT